jgi:PP-loop superfamily ATP-utilizing enzyme
MGRELKHRRTIAKVTIIVDEPRPTACTLRERLAVSAGFCRRNEVSLMFNNDFAESKITVNKAVLLAAITKNREVHEADFKEANSGFKVAVELKLREHLELLHKEGKAILSIKLEAPQEHTKDYDRVIRMLEMSVADEVTISEAQFRQYVMDDWDWKERFSTVSSSYKH